VPQTPHIPLHRRIVAWSRADRAAGITLAVATVAALAWANFDWSSYASTWTSARSWLELGALHFTARDWVNEGLMTLFFVVVGLEIRRETAVGELRSWRRAGGPVVAAIAGMVVPALVYAAFNHDRPGGHGWGIPMATDVAFSLGALALVASSASLRLRVFLMTLAVADDILSILVLAVAYSAAIDPTFLLTGLGCLVAMVVLRRTRGPSGPLPLVFGALAWWAFARGGVEAAIVGVVIGFAGLASPGPPAESHSAGPRAWERRLTPLVTLVVLPVFALANAGVNFTLLDLSSADAMRVFVAVLVARVVGKPVGVWLGATAASSRSASPSADLGSNRARAGLGAAASVGFTVSLLIVRVAFGEGPLADAATAGLIAATVVGLALTALLLRRSRA